MEHYIKSNENSSRLREIGNQFYSKRKFFDAILKYNESLCYAENHSENAGLAYANRSALYFEMKLYDKSLRNIELARANNYPKINSEILDKREKKCHDLMKNYPKISADSNIFSLSHDPRKIYPSISDCLEVKKDEKFGRYIITNKSLCVGDVIAIEEPVCKILKEDYIFQRCSHCLKSNFLDLIPCGSCSRAMYCSEVCAKTAYDTYHRFECSVSKLISSSFLNANMQMALRIFFIALSVFKDSAVDLMKYLEVNDPCTAFDISSESEMKEKILAVNSSVYDDAIEVNDILFDELFLLDNQLKKMWDFDSKLIKKFLIRHTQISALNCHEIYGWPLKKGGFIDPEVENLKDNLAYCRSVTAFGNGRYLFSSLLNHSCSPNISKVFIDDKIVMIVHRPINAGDQIFDNYGCSFTNIARETRQLELLNQYRFVCSCIACRENYNLLPSLKVSDKTIFKQARKVCQELKNLNQKKSRQKFRDLSVILQKNLHFPSMEVCSLIESFQACMEIMLKPDLLFP